jgi:lysophospholipase L1-like esterase
MHMPSSPQARCGLAGLVGALFAITGCSGEGGGPGPVGATGGAASTGGELATGGNAGGSASTGGNAGTQGGSGAGGTTATGGATSVGGRSGAGGSSGVGGRTGGGGATAAGGVTGAGDAGVTGGTRAAGGVTGTGGAMSTGGRTGAGGATSTGGTSTSPDGGGLPDGSPDTTPGDTGGGTPGVWLAGRFDYTDATRPSFGWSGSAMVARFSGTGATLRIDGSPNQFAVVVDGKVAQAVLKVVGGTTQYALASGLAAGVHDVVVWKRTEANQGENRFLGLDVTGGQLQAPPAAPDRRVEIYGDSITAGYGLDGVGPNCPYSPDTEDHYLTYAAISARDLGADLHAIAWSGIGMYRNYGQASASSDAMPYVYARTLGSQTNSVWDFSKWQPHVVVVNLGTNDFSTNGDPGSAYETAYLGFVRSLRQKYPDTFFVLTIGPMLDGDNLTAARGHIQNVIKTRGSEGDSKMSYLEFPTQTSADGYGCDWHPSAATNVKMATLLTAELKTRLGW